MFEGPNKQDWFELFFWIRKIEGRPVSPRSMTEEDKRELLRWMQEGKKYDYDGLKWIAETFQNGSTNQ